MTGFILAYPNIMVDLLGPEISQREEQTVMDTPEIRAPGRKLLVIQVILVGMKPKSRI